MKVIIQVSNDGRTGVVRKTTDGRFTLAEYEKFLRDALAQVGETLGRKRPGATRTRKNSF